MSSRFASLALLAGLAGAPAVAFAGSAPVAAQVEKSTTPARAAQSDVTSYAQRDASDKKTADFEGGSVVVVMSGTALVALILILLLI